LVEKTKNQREEKKVAGWVHSSKRASKKKPRERKKKNSKDTSGGGVETLKVVDGMTAGEKKNQTKKETTDGKKSLSAGTGSLQSQGGREEEGTRPKKEGFWTFGWPPSVGGRALGGSRGEKKKEAGRM